MASVLVVDGRAENRQLLATLLTEGGYRVVAAADLPEAVTRLRVTPIDLVLANVQLEGDDNGLKLLRMIKSELSHMPVVL